MKGMSLSLNEINTTLLRLVTELEKSKETQGILMRMMQQLLSTRQNSDGPQLPEGIKLPVQTMTAFDLVETQLEDKATFSAMRSEEHTSELQSQR